MKEFMEAFGKKIKEITAALFMAIVLTAFLCACAGTGNGDAGIKEEENDSPDKVVVISPHPVDFMKPLLNEFESQTGITVEIIRSGTSEAVKRISGNEAIDVLWGGSVLTVSSYDDSFAEYTTVNYEDFSEEFRDMPEGVTCFTDVPSVLIVNTDLCGDISIEGYEDLLDPRLKGRIAFASPEKSSSSFEHLVNMLYAMGGGNPENGWDYAQKLADQIGGNLLEGSSQVYNGVASGKFIVGLTFEEAAITQMKAGRHVKIVYMKEGVVFTPDGLYISKKAKNPENARKFVDFMTSKDTQRYISADLGRRSVLEDVEESPLVTPKEDINVITVDSDTVTSCKDEWTLRFAALCGEDGHE